MRRAALCDAHFPGSGFGIVVFGAGCGLTGRAGVTRATMGGVQRGTALRIQVASRSVTQPVENVSKARAAILEGAMQQTLHFICEQRSAGDEVSGAVADCGGDKVAMPRCSLFISPTAPMNKLSSRLPSLLR